MKQETHSLVTAPTTGNGFRCLLTAVLLLTTQVLFAAPQTLTIRADEWCPFYCDPNSDKPGVMVEIARKAFTSPGHTLDIQFLEWSKAVDETRAGKFTMVAGADKAEVPDFIFPAEAQSFDRDCFYAKPESNWFYSNPASLNTIKLGVIADYSYGDDIDNWIKANADKVNTASGDQPLQDNLAVLAKGDIDALIESSAVMQWTLMQSATPLKIRQAGCTGKGEELFIAISPKQPDAQVLAQKLSTTVAAMRANGELKKLLAKYSLYDWK